jgi:hypothetical protein
MSKPAPTYDIRTIGDFLKVPEKRLGACLREFRVVLDMTRATERLMRDAEGVLYNTATVRLPLERFTWIDDKKGTLSLHILTKKPDDAVPGVAPREGGP